MRIRAIDLSWFRGASVGASLKTDLRSVLVYGQNGSGKSSFADAVEYALKDGKIGHLAHAYSGTHQEKGIRNTEAPDESDTSFRIELDDGSQYTARIPPTGIAARSGSALKELRTWDYHRVVLRQDEVASFIQQSKGEKYSVLTPLLGLQPLEDAADNLHRLARELDERSRVDILRGEISTAAKLREARLGEASDDALAQRIAKYHEQYCAGQPRGTRVLDDCSVISTAIDIKMSALGSELSSHLVISEIAKSDITALIAAVRDASALVAMEGTKIASIELEVLKSARAFTDAVTADPETKDTDALLCPACGQSVDLANFRSHVEEEEKRFEQFLKASDERAHAIGGLCDGIQQLRQSFGNPALASWLKSLADRGLSKHLEYLVAIDTESLRQDCSDAFLKEASDLLCPLIDAAGDAAQTAPPEIGELNKDKEAISNITTILGAKGNSLAVDKIDALLSFVTDLEAGIRRELLGRTRETIGGLTATLQDLWAIVHPENLIAEVSLEAPGDATKAIDIHLKFHGREQDSPRLTLSEGYRNSLGLCIFLALALEDDDRRPLILDDVVVSLDREHRGMIAELLEAEFADRQILVFTHDRDWFGELRRQLDESRWAFRTLLPFENPAVGIRWAEGDATFADARALMDRSPSAAGNTARTIMQTEMARTAGAVRLRLPYLRADRNDKRSPDEILTQFIAVARKCFQRRDDGGDFIPHTQAVEAFESARVLLVTWANTASHSLDVVRSEAEKLVNACEVAIATLVCSNCDRLASRAVDAKSEVVQCHCGKLRWRYGKDA